MVIGCMCPQVKAGAVFSWGIASGENHLEQCNLHTISWWNLNHSAQEEIAMGSLQLACGSLSLKSSWLVDSTSSEIHHALKLLTKYTYDPPWGSATLVLAPPSPPQTSTALTHWCVGFLWIIQSLLLVTVTDFPYIACLFPSLFAAVSTEPVWQYWIQISRSSL